jgi:hypothetical protein
LVVRTGAAAIRKTVSRCVALGIRPACLPKAGKLLCLIIYSRSGRFLRKN